MNMMVKNERIAIQMITPAPRNSDSVSAYGLQPTVAKFRIVHNVGVELEWITSARFESSDADGALEGFHGLLIPGGFGERGVEGMIGAVRRARENDLPFFGICLGLQTAIIEFARNVCGLEETNSSEFETQCTNPVISLMSEQHEVLEAEAMGGTMRLGAYPCRLRSGSRAARIYGEDEVNERHRHRYEVNNKYRELFEEYGLQCTGTSPDNALVEMIELPNHPWFMGCQFHPELQSRPTRPHPLFASFVKAALERKHRTAEQGGFVEAEAQA